MAWNKSGRIQRPQAWAVTGTCRELVRRLPRCAGSRRRLLALVERRGRGMGGLGATGEEAAAFAGRRGPLASGGCRGESPTAEKCDFHRTAALRPVA